MLHVAEPYDIQDCSHCIYVGLVLKRRFRAAGCLFDIFPETNHTDMPIKMHIVV